MRVAFISTIHYYPLGGADALWVNTAEYASRQGHDLFIAVSKLVSEHPRVQALQASGAKVFIRDFAPPPRSFLPRLKRRLLSLTGTADPLLLALQKFSPDLVIFSYGGTYDCLLEPHWYEWLQSKNIPFRIIINWQEESPFLPHHDIELASKIFSMANRVYFISRRNQEVTRNHLNSPLSNSEIVQIPLRWRPEDKLQWPQESNFFSLATVARLEPVKGIELFLQAAQQSLKGENYRIQIIGIGPMETELRALTKDLELDGKVHFRGYVATLRDTWMDNHIFISPARNEGIPLTIPEALLCGRPVLATKVGGAMDWIEPEVTGFLCPTPSVSDLAESLHHAWRRREDWKEMGEAAHRKALARYLPEDFHRLLKL